jgi:hypothetical protein
VLLVISEFLDLFRVHTELAVIDRQTSGDHHSYALLLVGVAVIGAALLARSGEAWPPAAAVTALGALALAIALLGDLPDATSSGLTAQFENAETDPATGFWMELAGAAAAFGGGAAMTILLRQQARPDSAPEPGPTETTRAERR